MSSIRSVRFREEELDALEALSRERNVAVNGLVRIAVRALAGLPNPSWAGRLLDEEREHRQRQGEPA